jgi:hypothetical protein
MKWEKLGFVYAPSGESWWAKRYALLPTPELPAPGVIRVYFASLDDQQFGRIGYVDLDAADPRNVLFVSEKPVLDLGQLGSFDDSGVNPSCLIIVDARRYLYYIGWQRCARVPYMLFTGLAISDDGGRTFNRHARVPILDRTQDEPFSRSAPFVMFDGRFRMWYWSCTHWTDEKGWIHYHNVIRCAESTDGMAWRAEEGTCIAPEGENEYSVGRPWVVKDAGIYRMWYSIRSNSEIPYRIGYAESFDGLTWVRKDRDAGISPSLSGWDSEMICYSSILPVADKLYMFYNGNRHGSTGFGCAVLVTEDRHEG